MVCRVVLGGVAASTLSLRVQSEWAAGAGGTGGQDDSGWQAFTALLVGDERDCGWQ